MKSLYLLHITLSLKGPVLTKSTNPASFGLDAVVARDFRTGRPMLPGTLIEGRVREALHQLEETSRLDEFFGKTTRESSLNKPSRGRLTVDDLLATTNGSPNRAISRTAVDSALGSAKGEALRVIETPFQPGQPVEFTGLARVFCADDNEAKEIARLLQLGLAWQVQFGAQRTTGFGRSEMVKVEAVKAPGREPTTFPVAPIAIDLAIHLQGPLCIVRHKIGDNLFESDIIIPGNMLAGAIMQTANALGVTISEFDNLRFRHAFPTQGSQRPRALPLSTVRAGKKCLYDVADQRDPVLVKDDDGKFVAPAFPLDWKEHGDALGILEWAQPARELRVRTAIDSVKRTADRGVSGDEGALFAWEMVYPFADDHKTPIIWRTRIDLSQVTNAKATADALAKVLVWLGFVSKTKAFCEVLAKPVLKPEETPELKTDEPLFLVLQTPALLADPRFLENPAPPPTGALTAAEMLALYRAVWNELSSDSLVLSHHFAQQHLAGGNHLYHYFQKRKKADQPYDPWLLTDAGSVFVFTVKDVAKARAKLAAWLADGLPLPNWAKKRFGEDYTHNPYRPQNGFGEVAVHVSPFPRPESQPISLANPILPSLP